MMTYKELELAISLIRKGWDAFLDTSIPFEMDGRVSDLLGKLFREYTEIAINNLQDWQTNYGPLPDINVVNEDNPHGRNWHVISVTPVGPESRDYFDFGARVAARYESETGSCGSKEYKYADGFVVPARHCTHNYQHKYWADYFLNNGRWELGAN